MNNTKFQERLSFDDVLLVPQYSEVESRKDVSLEQKVHTKSGKEYSFKLPIISSPMDTITEDSMAVTMQMLGGLSIIHRYNTISRQKEIILNTGNSVVAVAVGISGDYQERLKMIVNDCHKKIVCFDVAHGHHILMKRALEWTRQEFGNELFIISGNVATGKGYHDLSVWGSDAVRLGIGNGSICKTRLETGHGIPLLHNILECDNIRSFNNLDSLILADGGIKNYGDAVKAYAAGADYVMCGSLLSGTEECPGVTETDSQGKKYKKYRGMASPQAQQDWKQSYSSNEGIETKVPYKGSVIPILKDFEMAIKSGLSYSGAFNLDEFRIKASFIKQTANGQLETTTHILNKHHG